MPTTLRISEETRDRLLQIAVEDYGGVTADAAVVRLLDEHWERQALAAMDQYRVTDPQGWAEYLDEAERLDSASAPVTEPWDTEAA